MFNLTTYVSLKGTERILSVKTSINKYDFIFKEELDFEIYKV